MYDYIGSRRIVIRIETVRYKTVLKVRYHHRTIKIFINLDPLPPRKKFKTYTPPRNGRNVMGTTIIYLSSVGFHCSWECVRL